MDIEALAFCADAPYPLIKPVAPNRIYARWMLDNMGGPNSEMSAVSLYFYDHLITEEKFSEVSAIFHKIFVVEMHHLEIFGKLALELGENPLLCTRYQNRRSYWTPGYNKYPTDFGRLVQAALESEQAAVRKYENQINCVTDPNIIENLMRIIMDERLHIQIFSQIMMEYRL